MRAEDFFNRPYIERQLVVFINDSENKTYGVGDTSNKKTFDGFDILSGLIFSPFPTIELIELAIKIYKKSQKKGLKITPIPYSWIHSFKLQPGHPRENVLYAAHPTLTNCYVPVSDFHRFTFEHKFSEILSILMHLGAEKLYVEHVKGWGKEFTSKISAGIPNVEVGIDASISANKSNKILYQAEFDTKQTPVLPDNLIWYNHEPTWQSIVEGRLDFGMKNFSLQLMYLDDFGVNSNLRAKAEKLGLDLAGNFEKHESTTWTIKGTFSVV
jgi:hypothetical protein